MVTTTNTFMPYIGVISYVPTVFKEKIKIKIILVACATDVCGRRPLPTFPDGPVAIALRVTVIIKVFFLRKEISKIQTQVWGSHGIEVRSNPGYTFCWNARDHAYVRHKSTRICNHCDKIKRVPRVRPHFDPHTSGLAPTDL